MTDGRSKKRKRTDSLGTPREGLRPFGRAIAFALWMAVLPADPSWAQNPKLGQDFQSMMEWLSAESAEGLAFHSSVSFDPPIELRPGEWNFDASMGLGTIPLNKGRFPRMKVKTLQDIHPEESFSDTTIFPDATLHVRRGFPGRWELAWRWSDMTMPRMKISPATEGKGQSNIAGFEVRKHLGETKDGRITLYATYDHLDGAFKFYNSFSNVEVSDTLFLDAKNQGLMAWNFNTYGIGLMASHEAGNWVPYYGLGYHYSKGVMHTRLVSTFSSSLIDPVVGDSKQQFHHAQNLRAVFGTMIRMKPVSYFISIEVMALGSNAGRAFAVHSGLSIPLRIPTLRETVPSDLKDAPRSLEEEEEVPSTLILLR